MRWIAMGAFCVLLAAWMTYSINTIIRRDAALQRLAVEMQQYDECPDGKNCYNLDEEPRCYTDAECCEMFGDCEWYTDPDTGIKRLERPY